MKLVFTTLLIVSFVLTSSLLQTTMAQYPSGDYPCDSKCKARCEVAGVKKRCLNYCGICCRKCKCVPSGTVGNKSDCPCYRDMISSKGKPKCP
ncbi:peamaclein-like [Actinidia eriantha]|uniref:peamaclein-like n=1 Tax=Actinidia eriantha TaxID=165200 RepID=UPI00258C4BCB|nr:peamaclein-like [Actinidia eriantha]